MRPGDWPAVERIYAAGIATGNATFETEPPAWADFDASKLVEHRLVADVDGRVVGWAAAVAVSDRCTYAGVVEHSAYVDPSSQGVASAERSSTRSSRRPKPPGFGPIQSGIFPENHASLALHERAGSTKNDRRPCSPASSSWPRRRSAPPAGRTGRRPRSPHAIDGTGGR